jgi:hypothetical protein
MTPLFIYLPSKYQLVLLGGGNIHYVYVDAQINNGKQSTLSAGPFNSHGSALVWYKAHCLMQHVQGYTGSLWTPPYSDCSICIALAAARATANKTTMKKYTNFAGHSDGNCGAGTLLHTSPNGGGPGLH